MFGGMFDRLPVLDVPQQYRQYFGPNAQELPEGLRRMIMEQLRIMIVDVMAQRRTLNALQAQARHDNDLAEQERLYKIELRGTIGNLRGILWPWATHPDFVGFFSEQFPMHNFPMTVELIGDRANLMQQMISDPAGGPVPVELQF